MKVVLMSDSHGKNQWIDLIMEMHNDADVFLHCGDIECSEDVYPAIKIVRGNNDYYGNYPDKMILHLGSHHVLMMHSHLCYARDRMAYMSRLAKEEGCDTVFFGHTHIATDQIVDGVRLINPGSLYYTRDGRPISYCVIQIDDEMKTEFHFAPFQ